MRAAPGLGLSLTGASLLSGCASAPELAAGAAERGAVVPFSQLPANGAPPVGWAPYIIRRDLPKTSYAVERRDGRSVLHANADCARSGLHCPVHIDPAATPWLRWQWRVDALHEDATVGNDDAEDTPVRLVVAFAGDVSRLPLRDRIFFEQVELFTGNKLPFATLTYVWDGQLPVGRVVPYARTPRIQYQVVESGPARLGQWLAYERNVVEDFTRVFGQAPPGHISSVGVLTDSDDLKNQVEAWYGDIGLFAGPQQAG
ncbi:MAG: hypothetical protein AD742_07760 [Methylibium sp. NZG]|nr:MAG: hypothetical protein AD742_07760 [Methylibium sp. NZG]